MTSIINTNLNSLSAQRQLSLNGASLGTAIQRLSSGLRINSAKDDAAGLAISERFTSQIKGTDQAARNSNDAISLAQTAEGALASISNNLQRIRELAVQSANGANSSSDRAALQAESAQLIGEVDRIASQTEFNGSKLLDGSFAGQQFQLGANAGDTVKLAALQSMGASSLGRWSGFNQTTATPNSFFNGAQLQMFSTVPPPGGVSLEYYAGTTASDAAAVAAAWNSANVPGLHVTALTNTVSAVTQTSAGSSSGTAVLTLNGVNINLGYVSGGLANAQNRTNALAAINAQSANTGVVASDAGVGISLTAADGRNIVTSFSAGTATGSGMSDFGLGPVGTTMSNLNFTYHTPADLVGKVGWIWFNGSGYGSAAGLVQANGFAPDDFYSGTSVAATDISTMAGASAALATVDTALATISTARANLGAALNRFQSAIANLQISAENMSASRSRIVDADFAQETANLSRSQILQQASTAMVAQANQATQGVLALLR